MNPSNKEHLIEKFFEETINNEELNLLREESKKDSSLEDVMKIDALLKENLRMGFSHEEGLPNSIVEKIKKEAKVKFINSSELSQEDINVAEEVINENGKAPINLKKILLIFLSLSILIALGYFIIQSKKVNTTPPPFKEEIPSTSPKKPNIIEPIAFTNQYIELKPNLLSQRSTSENNNQSVLEEGVKFFIRKDYVNAELKLKEYVQKVPSDLEAKYYLGTSYLQNEKQAEAINIFDEIKDKEFMFQKASIVNLALAYISEQKIEDAKKLLDPFKNENKVKQILDGINYIQFE